MEKCEPQQTGSIQDLQSGKTYQEPLAVIADWILGQRELWGEQNHNPHIYMSILLEEVGEAAQALNEFYFKKEPKELEHFREELVQSAAVAISIVECIDRDKWVRSK